MARHKNKKFFHVVASLACARLAENVVQIQEDERKMARLPDRWILSLGTTEDGPCIRLDAVFDCGGHETQIALFKDCVQRQRSRLNLREKVEADKVVFRVTNWMGATSWCGSDKDPALVSVAKMLAENGVPCELDKDQAAKPCVFLNEYGTPVCDIWWAKASLQKQVPELLFVDPNKRGFFSTFRFIFS